MKKKTRRKVKYTNEPLELETVPDFLPPPKDLTISRGAAKTTAPTRSVGARQVTRATGTR